MRRLYRVPEMDCAHEGAEVRRAVEALPGVESVALDYARRRLAVAGDVPRDAVAAAVARTGMRAEPWSDGSDSERRLLLGSTALSGAALLGGLASGLAGGRAAPFLAVAVAAGVWHVLPRAARAARHLRPDMHLLMTVAIAGALAIGEWTEAASVAFLYSLSLLLEAWSVARARTAVERLLDLAPATATLADGARTVPADQVAVGALILVRPGERLPLDGVVKEGASTVDQSPITGESLPVERGPGDEVFAGTVNGPSALVVETTRAAPDTTLAHMARLVEEAGAKRSRAERWVERFARIYTPAVLAGALLILLVPPLLLGGGWGAWFYRALVLLVIACPCALVISTPVTVVAALAGAARHGVLVKGGEFLETPARLAVVAFDKTGTLTRGRPRVVEVVAYGDHDEDEVLARAAAVETRSEHPIAHAIVRAARERDVDVPPADDVRAVGGKGAEGRIDGRRFWIGSHRWLDELRGAEHDDVCARMENLAGPGRSVLFVGHEDHVCGLIAVEDEVRPEVRAHLDALRAAGVGTLAMLTGDNRPTAEAVAALTGIDHVEAELLPEQKVEAVARLRAGHGPVAMIGDGINDAAAMARADIGVAMGAKGTDIAIEAADVALMTDDLSRLAWLVRHSRRTVAIIRENVAAALVVKAAFVVLTLTGDASLWAAIAADMGTSLAVIANAMRAAVPVQ